VTRTYRVGLLGMGRIMAGLDIPGDAAVRTHLKGLLCEPRLKLAMVSDLKPEHAAAELRRFAVDAAVVPTEAILSADLDALCIATPDGTHLDYVQRAAKGSARVLLVEKPLEADS
jgi:predicted dehydrogenase